VPVPSAKIFKIAFQLDAMMNNGFGKTLTEAENKFESLGNKVGATGKSLTLGLTMPLMAVGAAAIAVGTDYETMLGGIQSRTGMAVDEVEKFSASIRNMALSGDYGNFTARNIAQAYSGVAVAGQDAATGTALMRSSMVMATATGNDLGQTAYFLSNYLLKIGADAAKSEKYINLFTQGILNTGMGLSDMQNYMFRMTPAFEQMGSSVQTNVGIMTKLYQVGVRGAALYTGMGTIMSDFALGGNIAAAATERFGVSLYDANGRMRASEDVMFDVAIAMRDYADQCEVGRFKLDNLNQSQQAAWFEFIRNAEVIQNRVIPGLYGATDAAAGTGVAFDKAAKMSAGMAGTAQQLHAALEEIMLQISDHLLPHATRFVEFVGAWIARFASLDEGTQRIIIGLALVAAAAGPVLMVTGKIIKFVGGAVAAYTQFRDTLKAVKTATELARVAQDLNTKSTKLNALATSTAKKASAARKAAQAAETAAVKAAEKAEMLKATAGVASAKTTTAIKQAEHLRTVATVKSSKAVRYATLAEKQQTRARVLNTTALDAGTVSKKANALATTRLGKTYALLLKAQATSVATLKGQTLAMKLSTIAKGALSLGTKGLTTAFKVMSKAIMAIPVFGWILLGVTALVAGIVLLVRWVRSVGDEYRALGDEAERLAERQEALAQASANAIYAFNHEARVLEARSAQYEHLANCIEHATRIYSLHRREVNRLSYEYTELGLGLQDTQSAIDAIETKLAENSNRRRADMRTLQNALVNLRAAETAYIYAMEANRRKQADLAAGIAVHADVLADLERQQQAAAAAMAAATAEMEYQAKQAEKWERAQSDALDRMNSAFENYKRLTTNAFRVVTEDAAISVAELTHNLLSNAATIEEWSKNMADLAERGLDEGLIEQLRKAGPEAAATVRGLVHASYEELEALNYAFADSTRVAVESMQRELDPLGVANSAEELIDHVAAAILENKAMEYALIDKVNAGFAVFSESIQSAGFDDAGYNIALGVADGIVDGTINIERAMVEAANRGVTAFAGAMGIYSPSRRMRPFGGYTVDGYTSGIYAKSGEVEKAFKWIGSYGISKMSVFSAAAKAPKPKKRGGGSGIFSLPEKSKAYKVQRSLSNYPNLFGGNDEQTASTPLSSMQRMSEVVGAQGGEVSINYNPVYHIENSGSTNMDDLMALLKQRDSEGEARLRHMVIQVMRDEEYRMKRVANA